MWYNIPICILVIVLNSLQALKYLDHLQSRESVESVSLLDLIRIVTLNVMRLTIQEEDEPIFEDITTLLQVRK
jgi:hypothetical protein